MKLRVNAGLCPLKDFDNQIQALNENKPLRNGRAASIFGKFSSLKFSGYRTPDKKIREDPTNSVYGNVFKNPSIKLSNFPRIVGDVWNDLEFFGSKFEPSYTKPTFGPLDCGVFRVRSCPLDMLETNISASISTIFQLHTIKTRRKQFTTSI
jgi:hypothetical protein